LPSRRVCVSESSLLSPTSRSLLDRLATAKGRRARGRPVGALTCLGCFGGCPGRYPLPIGQPSNDAASWDDTVSGFEKMPLRALGCEIWLGATSRADRCTPGASRVRRP